MYLIQNTKIYLLICPDNTFQRSGNQLEVFQIRNTVEVVADITADPTGDHLAKWIPPPLILLTGTFNSDAVFQTYMVLSAAELDKSKDPWGFQDRDVTGWWYFKSSDKKETQAAEGLATTDKGSTGI